MIGKSLIITAGLMGLLFGNSADPSATSFGDTLSCEIVADNAGGMMQLKGVVRTHRAIEGRYTLTVKSAGRSGRTNISQGGGFSASGNRPETLGMVMLSANESYDVRLDVSADGESIECSDRLGNTI